MPASNILRTSFEPTVRLIRQIAGYGSPYRLLRAGFRVMALFLNLPGHLELLRVTAHSGVIGLTRRQPKLPYKYLASSYLVKSFSRDTRLRILIHHYRFLASRAKGDFLVRVTESGYPLWEECMDGHAFKVTLACPPSEHEFEGDLLLLFWSGSVPIYSITFTLSEGRTIGVASDRVLLVTAIQGMAGKIDLIRQATRICQDTPAHLLLAAAEAIAVSLDIGMLAGIGLDQQVQRQVDDNPRFKFDYDEFWRSIVGERTNSIFYLLPVPFPQKPIESVRSKHRSREVRRRQLKGRISESVRISFRQNCLKDADSGDSMAASRSGTGAAMDRRAFAWRGED